MINPELLDTILLEWSYRLKDGIPDVNDPEKVKVLNQVLAENKLPNYPPLLMEGTAETNQQEALVCYFYDIMTGESGEKFVSLYDAYLAQVSKDPTKTYDSLLADYGGDIEEITEASNADDKKIINSYKELLGISKRTKFDKSRYDDGKGGLDWKTPHLSIIENENSGHNKKQDWITQQYSCAKTIYSKVGSKFRKSGLIDRGKEFNSIKEAGTKLLNGWKDAGVKSAELVDDKWTPADVFITTNGYSGIKGTKDILSVNEAFYGSNNTESNTVGISLKMADARGGKGTSFLQLLGIVEKEITVSEPVSDDDTLGTKIIKYNTMKRYHTKYLANATGELNPKKIKEFVNYFSGTATPYNVTDIVKSGIEDEKNKLNKLNKKLVDVAKIGGNELKKFFKANASDIDGITKNIIEKSDAEIKKLVRDFETKYKNEHDNFKKYASKQTGVSIKSDSSLDAIKKAFPAEDSLTEYIGILSKKALAYKNSSKLVEQWEKENTKIVKPLEKIKQYNPFIALTLFCVCQYGLNPTFYKCIAKPNGGIGEWEEFPNNNLIKKGGTEKVDILDSPTYGGFQMDLELQFNNDLTYKTRLSFTFSNSTFKIEVDELKQI